MRDPFPPPNFLVAKTQPLAALLSLSTLPFHSHEILLAWAAYHVIEIFVAPAISIWLFPENYSRLAPRTKSNWNIRVVSIIQATFISALALYVIWIDDERRQMDWKGRIWGYTGGIGMVQGFAAGYFLWDLASCLMHFEVGGWQALLHAVSAFIVTALGFRPFANYYGVNFILYELSTPFLNVHWYCDKLGLTGSHLQLYNGIVLISVFFLSRLVWGMFQTVCIYLDVWSAIQSSSVRTTPQHESSDSKYSTLPGWNLSPKGLETLPMWLVVLYLGSNTMLNVLNIVWFGKMIQTLMKRFDKSAEVSQNGKMILERKEK